MMSFISYLLSGISLGSVYAIIALGYTMVYGIAKMLNFAHGDILMVGGYTAFIALNQMGLPIPIAVLLSMTVCTALGVLIERVAYKPLRNANALAVLITAIGVSYLLQNLALLLFGANPKSFTSFVKIAPLKLAGGNLVISGETIVTILVGALVAVCLISFIQKTKAGQAMLAVSEDKGAASLMGVTGAMPGIKAFVAAVLGGIGSIPGAFIGGILLGILENLSKAYISSKLSDAIVFSVLIIVLLIKPTGILGKKIMEKV